MVPFGKVVNKRLGMNVLVIDDSDISREVITHVLEDAGHCVVGMSSPIGATRAVIEHKISVVVLDVQLPSISGDRLAAMFRKQSRLSKVGVVLVSGIPYGELVQLGGSCEADAVVHKEQLVSQLALAVTQAAVARR